MMKNLLLGSSLLLASAAFVACDSGSAVVNCEADADCPDDKPVCDTSIDPGVCTPEEDEPECEEDLQCQVTDSGGSDACESNDDCGGGEACVDGSNQEAHCVLLEGGGCVDSDAVDATDAAGDEVSVCVDTAIGCNADNECE